MRVLVDTPVWSLALRRAPPRPDPIIAQFAELIRDGRACIIGAIRQEILSGMKSGSQYERLREHLRAFPDIALSTADYEQAARHFNQCRAKGIQGSNTDFLICATARRRGLAILTTDGDFEAYSRILDVRLYQPA